MPIDTQYSTYTPGVQGRSYMYGAEYKHFLFVVATANNDATCAVCYVSSRETQLMLPAKTSCPTYLGPENIMVIIISLQKHYRANLV